MGHKIQALHFCNLFQNYACNSFIVFVIFRVSLCIECKRVTDLDKDTKDFVFHLCKENMQSL